MFILTGALFEILLGSLLGQVDMSLVARIMKLRVQISNNSWKTEVLKTSVN